MTTLIVAASATRSETPRNANGALFRYAYITEREMVYADTVTELCSYLIPTYDQLVEAGMTRACWRRAWRTSRTASASPRP